jgi:hypothetical protein
MVLIQRFSSEGVCSFITARNPAASLEFTFDVFELLEQAALLRDEQFGVTDNVEKEHMGDLKLDLLFNFGRHD